MGFSRIQGQFAFVIGMFLFLTMVLHLMSVSTEIRNNMFGALTIPTVHDYFSGQVRVSKFGLEIDYVYNSTLRNSTIFIHNMHRLKEIVLNKTVTKRDIESKKKSIDIWKVIPNNDRIVAQVEFVPDVDPDLPAKTILMANGVEGWGALHGSQTFAKHECPIQNCQLINQPIPGRRVDARMFKENDLNKFMIKSYLDITPRDPEQVWIMFALESPEASPSYDSLHHVINWTATYRYDSTMITPYDKFLTFDNFTTIDDYTPDKNYARTKTKLAAAFISNCDASNNRLEYIKQLQEYMEVDFYGYCGTMSCKRGNTQECFRMLKKDYMFYFSFENANCRYYITEKLFLNALRNDVVPVVMGAHPDDYKRMAPAGSYIHVEQFPDAKHLAEYLIKLSHDETEYNKYFRWKQTGRFYDTKFWCRICSMLWDPAKPHTSVADLDQWWRGPGICIGRRRWDQVETQTTATKNTTF